VPFVVYQTVTENLKTRKKWKRASFKPRWSSLWRSSHGNFTDFPVLGKYGYITEQRQGNSCLIEAYCPKAREKEKYPIAQKKILTGRCRINWFHRGSSAENGAKISTEPERDCSKARLATQEHRIPPKWKKLRFLNAESAIARCQIIKIHESWWYP